MLLRAGCVTSRAVESQESETSAWDEYRNTQDYVDSDEDDYDRSIRLKMEQVAQEHEKTRTLILPAGIDVGIYIEETLKRMPTPAVGPKNVVQNRMAQEEAEYAAKNAKAADGEEPW